MANAGGDSGRLPYRKLTSRKDPRVFWSEFRGRPRAASASDDAVGTALALVAAAYTAEVSGPRLVDAQDGEATLSELRQMLLKRRLGLDDLVHDGQGWVTVRAYGGLADAVEDRELADRLRIRRRVKLGALLLAGTGVVVFLLAELFFGPFGP